PHSLIVDVASRRYLLAMRSTRPPRHPRRPAGSSRPRSSCYASGSMPGRGWRQRLTQPGRPPAARPARPPFTGPSGQALHRLAGWYAIALRLGGAVLFTAVAVLAATKQIS